MDLVMGSERSLVAGSEGNGWNHAVLLEQKSVGFMKGIAAKLR